MSNTIPLPNGRPTQQPPAIQLQEFHVYAEGPGVPPHQGPIMQCNAPNAVSAMLTFLAQVVNPMVFTYIAVKPTKSGIITTV